MPTKATTTLRRSPRASTPRKPDTPPLSSRVIAVLKRDHSATITSLAKELGVSQGRIYHMVFTLERQGLANRSGRAWHPGRSAPTIGNLAIPSVPPFAPVQSVAVGLLGAEDALAGQIASRKRGEAQARHILRQAAKQWSRDLSVNVSLGSTRSYAERFAAASKSVRPVQSLLDEDELHNSIDYDEDETLEYTDRAEKQWWADRSDAIVELARKGVARSDYFLAVLREDSGLVPDHLIYADDDGPRVILHAAREWGPNWADPSWGIGDPSYADGFNAILTTDTRYDGMFHLHDLAVKQPAK
jgi:hypothetical protein